MSTPSGWSVDCRGRLRGACLYPSCTCASYDGASTKGNCVKCLHRPGRHQNMSDASARQLQARGYPPSPPPTLRARSAFDRLQPVCFHSTHRYEDDEVMDGGDVSRDFVAPRHSAPRYARSSTNSGGDVFSSMQNPLTRRSSCGSDSPSRKKKVRSSTSRCSRVPVPRKTTLSAGNPLTAARSRGLPIHTNHFSAGQQICKLPGCGQPVYIEADGRAHDFCRKTHADQYRLSRQNFSGVMQTPAVSQHLQCETPGCTKQKYPNPQGGYFKYCSRSCRDNVSRSGLLLASASTPNLQSAGYGTCSLPGCMSPKYCDPANGRIHPYCGRSHATLARAQGVQPLSQATIRSANYQELMLVTQKFRASWIKGTCPNVDYAFVITSTTLESRWTAYRQRLPDQTVEEHYHGTKLTCNLSSAPCNDQQCGICGISNTGLDRRCIRKNINFQRFGHGFYLAPNSSKCHDYTQGANGYRAMLLCDVCPGRKYFLQTDNVQLQGPPQGYDSVYGQVGGSLNYPEIVVYNPDAIVPRYIIMYQKDGVGKIAK